MANNRMFIMHKPSGKKVYIGKRMSHGWHGVPDNIQEMITKLFEYVEYDFIEDGDSFVICLEDNSSFKEAIEVDDLSSMK